MAVRPHGPGKVRRQIMFPSSILPVPARDAAAPLALVHMSGVFSVSFIRLFGK